LIADKLCHHRGKVRGGGLIEPHAIFHSENADCLEQPKGPEFISIGSVFGGFA
jgi:hypothetical protein